MTLTVIAIVAFAAHVAVWISVPTRTVESKQPEMLLDQAAS